MDLDPEDIFRDEDDDPESEFYNVYFSLSLSPSFFLLEFFIYLFFFCGTLKSLWINTGESRK